MQNMLSLYRQRNTKYIMKYTHKRPDCATIKLLTGTKSLTGNVVSHANGQAAGRAAQGLISFHGMTVDFRPCR
jgi:hypothetical protein